MKFKSISIEVEHPKRFNDFIQNVHWSLNEAQSNNGAWILFAAFSWMISDGISFQKAKKKSDQEGD